MAKRSEEQELIRKWWVLLLLALFFWGLSYGFASLAIDSGSLWQYGVAIVFLVWGAKYIVHSARLAISK